jgi:thioredoxin reductase (NADPH)
MPPPSPHQAALTNDTFSEFVRDHRFAVIHFWGSWNGLDHMMQRLLDSQLPEEFRELVAFASFEVDPPAHHELCQQHNVVNVPFLEFYRDGSLIRTLTGLRAPEVITEHVTELVYGAAA